MLRQSCNSIISWRIPTRWKFQVRQNEQLRVSRRTLSTRKSSSSSTTTATTAVGTRTAKRNATTITHNDTSRQMMMPSSSSSLAAASSSSPAPKESIQDTIKNGLPVIGNGAYFLLSCGFLMTDMLQLRLMLVGGYAGLVTFHAFHPKPLKIPLRWSAFFVIVNAGAAMLLFMDEIVGQLLSEEEISLYEKHFQDDNLTRGQFYYLMKLARQVQVSDGSILTEEGQASTNICFIVKGQAKVYHHGYFAAYIDEGGFVNDVAFHLKQLAGVTVDGSYGTVIARGDCTLLVWDQSELRSFVEKRPDMEKNMKYTLSRHLVTSLLKQREARRSHREEIQNDDLNTELNRIKITSNGDEKQNTFIGQQQQQQQQQHEQHLSKVGQLLKG